MEEWSAAIFETGEVPTPHIGLYGEVCKASDVHMDLISFRGTPVFVVVRPEDVLWIPYEKGGIIAQWFGADSEEQFEAFAWDVMARDEWEETLEFDVEDPEIRIMDSLASETDGVNKIDVQLTPGRYRVDAAYVETELVMGTIFRLTRIA